MSESCGDRRRGPPAAAAAAVRFCRFGKAPPLLPAWAFASAVAVVRLGTVDGCSGIDSRFAAARDVPEPFRAEPTSEDAAEARRAAVAVGETPAVGGGEGLAAAARLGGAGAGSGAVALLGAVAAFACFAGGAGAAGGAGGADGATLAGVAAAPTATVGKAAAVAAVAAAAAVGKLGSRRATAPPCLFETRADTGRSSSEDSPSDASPANCTAGATSACRLGGLQTSRWHGC